MSSNRRTLCPHRARLRRHLVRYAWVPKRGRLARSLVTLGSIFSFAVSAAAQLKTKVTVDPSQLKAVVYTTSFGIVAERWDKVAYDQDTMKLLEDAGVTNVRVPGGGGVDALYHWSTGSIINPYTDDRAPAFPKERMFPAMVATMG